MSRLFTCVVDSPVCLQVLGCIYGAYHQLSNTLVQRKLHGRSDKPWEVLCFKEAIHLHDLLLPSQFIKAVGLILFAGSLEKHGIHALQDTDT